MALRIDLFRTPGSEPGSTVAPHDPASEFDPAGLVALGWVSASDPDEDALYYLLEELASSTGLSGVAEQGWGFDNSDALTLAGDWASGHAAGAADDPRAGWLSSIAAAIALARHAGAALYWHTRFDSGGSVDDGTDEFTTGWSHPAG